jgi:hypothetical protein
VYSHIVRHPFWVRSLIAIWGVWLGVVFSEPAALHSCPAHGDHAAHMASGPAGAPMSHDAMSHGTSHHDSGKPCTCLGASCCTAATVLPNAPVAEIVTTDVEVAVVVYPAVADRSDVVAPAHSLPFANGPPSTRSV